MYWNLIFLLHCVLSQSNFQRLQLWQHRLTSLTRVARWRASVSDALEACMILCSSFKGALPSYGRQNLGFALTWMISTARTMAFGFVFFMNVQWQCTLTLQLWVTGGIQRACRRCTASFGAQDGGLLLKKPCATTACYPLKRFIRG